MTHRLENERERELPSTKSAISAAMVISFLGAVFAGSSAAVEIEDSGHVRDYAVSPFHIAPRPRQFDAAPAPAGQGLRSGGPDCAVALDQPHWRAVWLGHFAGGRYVAGETTRRALDWQDQYYCFRSQGACQSWQRSMRLTYRSVEGYRTCVSIRSGPLQDKPTWESPPPSQD